MRANGQNGRTLPAVQENLHRTAQSAVVAIQWRVASIRNWLADLRSTEKPRSIRPRNGDYLMHYRNGREAKNGDKIIQIAGYGNGAQVVSFGVLFDAVPGNDHCNGSIAPITNNTSA